MQSSGLFPNAHQLPRKSLGVAGGLRGLRGITLSPFRGVDDVLASLAVGSFQPGEIAVKLACIRSY
jgi:hypothetical protein